MGGRGSFLPNYKNAEILRNKLKNYLLNPSKSPSKAKFFQSLGYNMKNWKRFKSDIQAQLRKTPAERVIKNKYGHAVKAYNVNMKLGINKTAIVLTSWQYDKGSNIPRLITAYPVKKK